jgi:hypothetical protein
MERPWLQRVLDNVALAAESEEQMFSLHPVDLLPCVRHTSKGCA